MNEVENRGPIDKSSRLPRIAELYSASLRYLVCRVQLGDPREYREGDGICSYHSSFSPMRSRCYIKSGLDCVRGIVEIVPDFFLTVRGGTAVWLRRRPIHPVKPALSLGRFYSNHPSVLGPAYSGPSDPPVLTMKPFTSRTRVRYASYVSTDNRQVQQVPSSPALRARSVLRANWPPTCLKPGRSHFLASEFTKLSSEPTSPSLTEAST
jgi:hypothetical protein